MSRKTYLWLEFEIEIFKGTNPYIMKADGNIFMRVLLYLRYLKILPREKLNMGRAVSYPKEFSNEITWDTIGYASTLSMDVVREIVDYKPLKQLVKSPIKFRNFETYMDFRALNEDITVGEVIRNKLKVEGLSTVDIQERRYVMHVNGAIDKYVGEISDVILLHNISEKDYYWLVKNMQKTI